MFNGPMIIVLAIVSLFLLHVHVKEKEMEAKCEDMNAVMIEVKHDGHIACVEKQHIIEIN